MRSKQSEALFRGIAPARITDNNPNEILNAKKYNFLRHFLEIFL